VFHIEIDQKVALKEGKKASFANLGLQQKDTWAWQSPTSVLKKYK